MVISIPSRLGQKIKAKQRGLGGGVRACNRKRFSLGTANARLSQAAQGLAEVMQERRAAVRESKRKNFPANPVDRPRFCFRSWTGHSFPCSFASPIVWYACLYISAAHESAQALLCPCCAPRVLCSVCAVRELRTVWACILLLHKCTVVLPGCDTGVLSTIANGRRMHTHSECTAF